VLISTHFSANFGREAISIRSGLGDESHVVETGQMVLKSGGTEMTDWGEG
jgi:hypothetical protein